MHIPTHQVHNVLNAYARRLKKKHDAANGIITENPENPVLSYSVEEKRRLIINKISANILKRIARSGSGHRSVARSHNERRTDGQTEEIRYHILTKNGEKISAKMNMQDADFLIKQLEEIARNSSGPDR